MKKRGIAILLAGIMAAALPVNAFASSGNEDTGVDRAGCQRSG